MPERRRIATFAYVDAFNLYYGCLRGTQFKWLDIHALLCALLPQNDIQRIKYFTARIKPRADDPQAAARQHAYLRALQTHRHLEVHYGHYLTHPVRMYLASPPENGPRTVEVIKTEEKGSDVNLATHLVSDAFERRFQCAVVITNDSDLTAPVLKAKELGYSVGVINPHKQASNTLRKAATFVRSIREGVLRDSQFPAELVDGEGLITKPEVWSTGDGSRSR